MRYSVPLIPIGLILVLGGCAVGPNYHRPNAATPPEWKNTPVGVTTNTSSELATWWKSLHDPVLDSLIDRAVLRNYDLKSAEFRVQAARALRGAVLADFLPTIGANASLTTARRSLN